jgi:hypothetical protein
MQFRGDVAQVELTVRIYAIIYASFGSFLREKYSAHRKDSKELEKITIY